MLHTFKFVTRNQVEEGSDPTEEIILPSGSHNIVAKTLEVPELGTEVERAVWQVEQALEKATKEEAANSLKVKVSSQPQGKDEPQGKSEKP